MTEEFDYEYDFSKFEETIKNLEELSKEIDLDCAALDEAVSKQERLKTLQMQFESNPNSDEAKKIKKEIKTLAEKIDTLLDSIKPVDNNGVI